MKLPRMLKRQGITARECRFLVSEPVEANFGKWRIFSDVKAAMRIAQQVVAWGQEKKP